MLKQSSWWYRATLFVAASAVMVSTAYVVEPRVAQAAEEPAGGQDAAAVDSAGGGAERPDAVSAMVTARVQDRRIEDVSQRSETSRVFANPDGSWTHEAATGPVRAQDEETGEWEDIDLTLVEDGEGGFAPKAALGGLTVSGGGDQAFASMSVAAEDGAVRELGWQWPEVLPEPVIEGHVATYPDVVDNGDLVVTATSSGFRHDIVLRQAPVEPVSFEIPVVTGGGPRLTADEDNNLAVRTRDGEELVTAAPPVMFDAARDDKGSPIAEVPVGTEVRQTGEGSVLTLSPDPEFLADPATQYPVTIDPAFTSFVLNDTWIGSGGNRHPWDETLHVGSDNGGRNKYRILMQFGNGPWSRTRINSAGPVKISV